jgi:hypothetical protein
MEQGVHMSRAIVRLLIFAIFISGCALAPALPQQDALPTQGLPDLNANWTLKMSHTGGIMGLSRSIEITSEGTYTAIDEREQTTLRGEISANELAQLTGLIETSLKAQPPARPTGNCADCFVYAFEFNDGSQTWMAQVDDITIAESGLDPLVVFLRGIMDRSLQ